MRECGWCGDEIDDFYRHCRSCMDLRDTLNYAEIMDEKGCLVQFLEKGIQVKGQKIVGILVGIHTPSAPLGRVLLCWDENHLVNYLEERYPGELLAKNKTTIQDPIAE